MADFPNTSWTLLGVARGATPDAYEAREEFARRYERPIRGYIAAVTRNPQEVQDLAQGFFVDVVATGRLIDGVDRNRGSFRPFLKQAVRHYLIDRARHGQREIRNPGIELRPDQWSGEGWGQLDVHAPTAPDAAFHQAWVRALLGEAIAGVKAICAQKGQMEHFDLFTRKYMSEDAKSASWKELGALVGLDEKAARSKTETVARHFRVVLRDMLRDEVGSAESVDAEIAELLALL